MIDEFKLNMNIMDVTEFMKQTYSVDVNLREELWTIVDKETKQIRFGSLIYYREEDFVTKLILFGDNTPLQIQQVGEIVSNLICLVEKEFPPKEMPNDDLIKYLLDCKAEPYHKWVRAVNANMITPYYFHKDFDNEPCGNELTIQTLKCVRKIINTMHNWKGMIDTTDAENKLKAFRFHYITAVLPVIENSGLSGFGFQTVVSMLCTFTTWGNDFRQWNEENRK